jgi:2-dehydropantoate 2-reductase
VTLNPAIRSVAIRSVAILGPGAVGAFLAALMWRAGQSVTCVARRATAARIARDGLRLESDALGTIDARPAAVSRLATPVDVLFVTTKAPGLAAALKRVPPEAVSGGLVVPLLNGLDHMAVVRSRFGPRIVAASIGHFEAARLAPGRIGHYSRGARIELASDGDVAPERLSALRDLLAGAGLAVAVLEREAEVLWGKLARLAPVALTTAASGEALGTVRGDPDWRPLLVDAAGECAAVASAEGVATDPAELLAQIDGLPAGLRSSLQRDVAAGRPSELDGIAGAVLRAGARHGLNCATIAALRDQIQARAGAPAAGG